MLAIMMISIPVLSHAECVHNFIAISTVSVSYSQMSDEEALKDIYHYKTTITRLACSSCGETYNASKREQELHNFEILTVSCRGTTDWIKKQCKNCGDVVSTEVTCNGTHNY